MDMTNKFLTLSPDVLPALDKCMECVALNGPVGDYHEYGLYAGYTFWYAQTQAYKFGLKNMEFWGFDSFEGLPVPSGIDQFCEFKKGDYAISYEKVVYNLDIAGVDWDRTHLASGFYEESLTEELKLQLGPVAIAMIDCDLYQSASSVLRFLGELLQDGSVLLFDDWNCFDKDDNKGERRAFGEFLNNYPKWTAEPFMEFGWHGQAFIVRE